MTGPLLGRGEVFVIPLLFPPPHLPPRWRTAEWLWLAAGDLAICQ